MAIETFFNVYAHPFVDTLLIFQSFTHIDYLADFPVGEEGGVYADSSIDPAMKNTFTQTRDWMMAKFSLTEMEAWTIITQAVNFGMTQLVDGNWGMHALIPKGIFEGVERKTCTVPEEVSEDEVEDEDSGARKTGFGLSLVLSVALLFVTFFN